jgi:hypothetical protein
MATTPNYGWVMPDPTDFVTSLPADFEIFGDAVDATVDGIETIANAAQPNVITTEGDLVVGDASGDPIRVPVGTIGQVLSSDGDTVEWVTPSGAATTWTLLNTGGTALTGAATITISGISDQEKLMIFIDGASAGSGDSIGVRIQGSASGYETNAGVIRRPSSYDATVVGSETGGSNAAYLGKMSNNTNSTVSGYLLITNAKQTGTVPRIYHGAGGTAAGSGTNDHRNYTIGGRVTTAVITNVSAFAFGGGNFDAGTIFVFGSAN